MQYIVSYYLVLNIYLVTPLYWAIDVCKETFLFYFALCAPEPLRFDKDWCIHGHHHNRSVVSARQGWYNNISE